MSNDTARLRDLGNKLAEIASLPVQQEKKRLWAANNDLKPIRPMVYIDQLPWNEIGKSDEMRICCSDTFLRKVEYSILQLLYRWKHFPCDMVVENRIDIPKTVRNLNYGIHIVENTRTSDSTSDVVSHQYEDQLSTPEQSAALKPDEILVDPDLDSRHLTLCSEIFRDILPVRLSGVGIHAGIWDRIAQMRPAENILWDLVDKPEFIKQTVNKFVELTNRTIDQCETLGLLDTQKQYIHCTGAYTNQLPRPNDTADKALASNCWAYGMAQLLSTVSPEMHDEFEIELVKPLYERFGLMYYGCCEPLEQKINIVKKIRNVRKISISPWAKVEPCAEQIGSDYVFSSKINPAYVASGNIDKDSVKRQISTVLKACRENSTPVELILKDISTVSYKPECIDRWNEIAMDYALN